eukprot:TRINITY_DN25115_c0_g1_i1.p1 TRINITY_DN25115_c0_g1~~TRINITY_DN25115_c0_g1_i1.p1  ORF type:complete len:119 (-),score=25.08 TRINITY_DN25115_c0_g1_i1:322-678(-)
MAMKVAARRLLADLAAKSRVGSCRALSGSGRVLSEEEKAAENVYIKKVEKERAEAAARLGVKVEEIVKPTDAPLSEAGKAEGAKKSRNVAVYAGIVGLIGLAYVLTKGKEPQKEKDRQ